MPRTNPPDQTGRSRTTMVKAVDREATPFENFENLTAKLLRVPKEEAQEQAQKRD